MTTDHGHWPLTNVVPLRAHSTERDLAAMLRRAVVHVASVALLPVDDEAKRAALAFVAEARALLRKVNAS